MRGTNLALFAIAGFLLIGISYVLLTGDTGAAGLARSISSGLGLSSKPSVNPELPPEEPEPAPKKATPRPAAKSTKAAEPETLSPAAPEKKSAPPPEPLVVPKVDQVPPGTKRADLLSRFPNPSVQTSTLHDGDLTEIFVYQNKMTPTATFIQMRSGVVIAAYTGIPARRLPN